MEALGRGHVMVADNVSVAYQTAGAGDPLVLLAGQSNTHEWWDRTRQAYLRRFFTVSIDWRGTGSSSRTVTPGSSYSTRLFADDVIAVLDALGVARTHLYGASMGGRVAQWLAIDHPTRVAGLVLGCTSMGGPASAGPLVPVQNASTDVLTDLMYSPAWRSRHPGPYKVLGDPSMTPRLRGMHARASRDHDTSRHLGSIRAATLVLHGADDRLTPPSNGEALAARIPGSRLVVLDGLRHAYFDEGHPSATEVVLEHLQE